MNVLITGIRHAFLVSLCCLPFLCIASQQQIATDSTSTPICELHVSICRQTPGEYDMTFQLVNTTTEPLNINTSTLPWNEFPLLKLQLFDDSQRSLSEVGSLFSLGVHETTIPPKSTVSGRRRLNARFSSLHSEIRKSGITVFWSYPIRGAKKEAYRMVGGLYIPMEQLATPRAYKRE